MTTMTMTTTHEQRSHAVSTSYAAWYKTLALESPLRRCHCCMNANCLALTVGYGYVCLVALPCCICCAFEFKSVDSCPAHTLVWHMQPMRSWRNLRALDGNDIRGSA